MMRDGIVSAKESKGEDVAKSSKSDLRSFAFGILDVESESLGAPTARRGTVTRYSLVK